MAADRLVAIIRKTVFIARQHQEKIQKKLSGRQGRYKPACEKPMWNEAEAAVDAANALWVKDSFLDHGRPLSVVKGFSAHVTYVGEGRVHVHLCNQR